MPTPISSIVAAIEAAGIAPAGSTPEELISAINAARDALETAVRNPFPGTIHTTYVNANTAGPTVVDVPGDDLLAVIVSTEQNTVFRLEAQTSPGVWSVVAVVANTTYRCWGISFPIPVPFASLRYVKTVGGAGSCHITFWTRTLDS